MGKMSSKMLAEILRNKKSKVNGISNDRLREAFEMLDIEEIENIKDIKGKGDKC